MRDPGEGKIRQFFLPYRGVERGLSGDLHPRSNIDICVPLLMAFWIKDNFGVKTNPHRGCEKCDNYCIKFTCDTYLM